MSIAALVAGAPLRVGSTNREAVKAVQAALHIAVDGDFGPTTLNAVLAFQKSHGLTADGQVGSETAQAIDALAAVPGSTSVQVAARSDFSAAPVWFQWALHELGVHEVGDNAGPDVERYIALAKCGRIGDPWCAIFMDAALEVNGIPGTRSASSQSFIGHPDFILLNGPALGAIAVFFRGSRNSGLGHVTQYRAETATHVFGLGGNEGDAVRIEPFPKSSATFGLRAYVWPKSVPLPKLGAIPIRSGQPLVQIKVV